MRTRRARHRGGSGAPEVILTMTNANTVPQLLVNMANLGLDVIELAAGNYTWQNIIVVADRTTRPLTIRPAAGAAVNFIGPASATGIIWQLGDGTHTPKWITWDGRNAGGASWTFRDFLLAQSGCFEPRGTDHLTFRNLTFTNIGRDGAFAPNPNQSWIFYMSGAGTGFNDHLLIEDCLLDTPAVNRTISAFALQSSGTFGAITIRRVTINHYDFGLYCERPITGVDFHDWTMLDTGDPGGPYSMRFAAVAVAMAGAVANITGTGGCNPYGDGHSGGGVITTSAISIS